MLDFWKDLAGHMSRPAPSRRAQLEEACVKVRRQLEVQRESRPVQSGGSNDERQAGLVAELESLLTDLEANLADLGPVER